MFVFAVQKLWLSGVTELSKTAKPPPFILNSRFLTPKSSQKLWCCFVLPSRMRDMSCKLFQIRSCSWRNFLTHLRSPWSRPSWRLYQVGRIVRRLWLKRSGPFRGDNSSFTPNLRRKHLLFPALNMSPFRKPFKFFEIFQFLWNFGKNEPPHFKSLGPWGSGVKRLTPIPCLPFQALDVSLSRSAYDTSWNRVVKTWPISESPQKDIKRPRNKIRWFSAFWWFQTHIVDVDSNKAWT